MKRLIFKFSTSRGLDTYGWNIVTLHVDGVKVAHECGGGYDMRGACLGDWIEKEFQAELSSLDPIEFYFRRLENGKNIVDGGVGFEWMYQILKALGFRLQFIAKTYKEDIYILTPISSPIA